MELKVLNANLWLLPPPASIDNGVRLDKFIDIVIKLEPDAINLQEVWLKAYVNHLKSRLKNYHLVSPQSFFYNKSGLVTLLKHKPLKSEFKMFNQTDDFGALEKMASKGYLKTEFKLNNKVFTLINTHIYESLEESKLRIKFEQAKRIVKRALEHNPTIVAGDMNMEPDTWIHTMNGFVMENKMEDTYSKDNDYANKVFNSIANKNGVHYKKPDYIFAHIKGAHIISEVIKDPLVSDHYPLLATITVPEQ